MNAHNAHSILIVDDEKYVLRSLQRSLIEEGYSVLTAPNGVDGLKVLEKEKVALVIADYRMPMMDGVEFLQKVKERWQETIRIMLTAYSDINVVVQAINRGEVYRFISKPWKSEELSIIISGGIAFYDLVQENKRLTELTKQQNEQLRYWSENLEKKVAQQANRIRSIFLSAIESLVSAIEAKDKYTEGHSLRVARISTAIARKLPLSEDDIERIRLAGLLHDIGKIGISEVILLKPGKLSPNEMNHVKSHPVISEHILKPIIEDKEVAKIIRHHHEHYSGIGYPDGIKGEEIPLGARILSIADAFDAITSDRPYSTARTQDQAANEIKRCSGIQFDPVLVVAFLKVIEDVDKTK